MIGPERDAHQAGSRVRAIARRPDRSWSSSATSRYPLDRLPERVPDVLGLPRRPVPCGRGGRDPSGERAPGRRGLEQTDELLDRERLALRGRPRTHDRPLGDRWPCTRTRSASSTIPGSSRRARCVPMSTPCSRAARIDSSIAPEPSHPAVPADVTTGAASPSRSASAARRNPSAIGERQMFPVQTTRIPLMTKGASLTMRVRPGRSSAIASRESDPSRRIDAGPWARSTHGGGDTFEPVALAQVDGDVLPEQRPGARRTSPPAGGRSGSRS